MTKTLEQIKAQNSKGVAALRARQSKFARVLGYTSTQNMLTRICNNDLTAKHLRLIKRGMK
jgi:prophage antirepressor-like protein